MSRGTPPTTRAATVVLAVREASSRSGKTSLAVTMASSGADAEMLAASISPFGATLESLADGSMLARVTAATREEQAENAARVALLIRDLHPDMRIAVATAPEGDGDPALDRAAELLAKEGDAAKRAVIVIDDPTAELLDTSFVLSRDDGRLSLVEMRVSVAQGGAPMVAGELARGSRVDRFVIEGLLGRGGMGLVYRARDTRLSRWVALKVLVARPHASDASREEAGARMLREARAAAAFNHPHVVSIFDVGESDGLRFIAMELVTGSSLRDLGGARAHGFSERLKWMLDVARALGAAHALGLVHRDMKPDNVMVREDGVAKVLDFGIARRSHLAVASASDWDDKDLLGTLTADGAIIGTPLYMAPEQLTGGVLDGRADQFSWAVTAFEVLSGELPWPGAASHMMALIRARKEPPRRLSDLCPEAPVEVTSILLRALSISPADRYPTMEALVADLEPLAASSSKPVLPVRGPLGVLSSSETLLAPARTISGSTTSATSTGTTSRRLRGALVAAGALLAIAGALFFARSSHQPKPPILTGPPEYAEALQLLRDGSTGPALNALRVVVAANPAFAPAYLRLALYSTPGPDARASMQKAMSARLSLPPLDRALADDAVPGFQPPPDLAAWEARAIKTAETYPGEATYVLALVRRRRGDADGAIAALEATTKIDPSFRAAAAAARAEIERRRSHKAEALAFADECLRISPNATDCLELRSRQRGGAGDCVGMERDARVWEAADLKDPEAAFQVASAIAARDVPPQAIMEALEQRWSRIEGPLRQFEERLDRYRLATLDGDFPRAIEIGRDMLLAVPSSANRMEHYAGTVFLMGAASEAGDRELAAKTANDYLAKAEGWRTESYRDETLSLFILGVSFLNQGVPRAEFLEKRERLVRAHEAGVTSAGRPADDFVRFMPWLGGYSMIARTDELAKEAYDALPRFGPLPAPGTNHIEVELAFGRVLARTGHTDEALPYLLVAAAGCHALELPNAYIGALLELGLLREKMGDRDAARKLYGEVVKHWAKKPPYSRQGAIAKARLDALDGKPASP